MAERLLSQKMGTGPEVTGWRHHAQGPRKNTTLFCLPGGGLTKDYFDLTPNYSFVDRMTAQGYDIILCDHLGIASNAQNKDFPYFTPRDAAAYLSEQLRHWCGDSPVIGIGHSMGGMMIMLMQGNHSPFKALGLFGSSAGGLDWGLSKEEKNYIKQEAMFAQDLEALSLAKFGAPYTRASGGPSGESIVFGGETQELTIRLRDISCEMNSASAMMSMMRGSFRTEVEAIDVPIFFAFGDHDIGIPPEDAPKDYINAPSAELVILEKTGHNHFAFSSIQTLCDKLDHWASNLD